MVYYSFEVKFRDGLRKIASKSKLIPASHLSPGDVVCFSTVGSTYQQGLLLEYDKEYDQFYVVEMMALYLGLLLEERVDENFTVFG